MTRLSDVRPRFSTSRQRGISGVLVGGVVIIVVIIITAGVYYATTTSHSSTTSSSFTTSSISTVSGLSSTSISTVSTVSTSATSITTSSSTPTLPSTLPSPSSPISEAGSSLLYPLFQLWAANFTATYPNVKVSTAAGGSGAGQSGVEGGTINIGASDAFLTNSEASANPGILNIAVAVSAQQVNYNVPGVPQTTHLNFTGSVLAGIYNGSITYWNAPAIKALNPGVASQLPDQLIVPLHRSDSSGDTDLFTTYLSDTSPDWNTSVGAGTSVSWPSVPSAEAENGNSGMLTACSQTKYCIAYIGVSYLAQATTDGLGNAALENQAGNFVTLTTSNVAAAVNAQYASTPANERYSLVYSPGATSYPIVNYEYAMVNRAQSSQTLATDIQAVLYYATLPQYGNSAYFLDKVGFVALPAPIAQLSWDQIAEITG